MFLLQKINYQGENCSSLNSWNLYDVGVWPFNVLFSLYSSLGRGDPHSATRGGQQVPLLLPHTTDGPEGGGLPGTVPWPHHPPGQTDPQHRHHDVHLRGGGLPARPLGPPPLLRARAPPSLVLILDESREARWTRFGRTSVEDDDQKKTKGQTVAGQPTNQTSIYPAAGPDVAFICQQRDAIEFERWEDSAGQVLRISTPGSIS